MARMADGTQKVVEGLEFRKMCIRDRFIIYYADFYKRNMPKFVEGRRAA